MRLLKRLLCCCLLLLAGCSATRLGYDHLDTLLRWQTSHYVDLNPQQQRDFDAEVQRLWRWHRSTQLPLYAAELRQLAGAVQQGPLGLAQIEAADAQFSGNWDNLVSAAVPGYARLQAQLSDAQVAELVRRIGKEIERRSRQSEDLDEAQRRQRMAERTEDLLRDWIGRPTAPQRQRVQQWAEQAQLPTPAAIQARYARLQRYAALLATRTQPGFEQRLRAFLEPADSADDVQAPAVTEQQRWLQLLADLSASLEAEQRERLRRRLLDYATDFETLAAEPPP